MITAPTLPDYVTGWQHETVRDTLAGRGNGVTIHRFRFTIHGHDLNMAFSGTDLERFLEKGWDKTWNQYFEQLKAKVEQKGGE